MIAPIKELFCLLDENREYELIVELGVWKCESAVELLRKFKIKRYVAVDLFKSFPEYVGDSTDLVLRREGEDKYYEEAKAVLSQFPNAELIRDFTHNAVKLFDDNSIDFVFIDACHEYKYVLQDIQDWYPKVKSSGIIGGDDYFQCVATKGRRMVQEAVNNFFDTSCVKVYGFDKVVWRHTTPRCWAVEKWNAKLK